MKLHRSPRWKVCVLAAIISAAAPAFSGAAAPAPFAYDDYAHVLIARRERHVYISPIFKWFAPDFAKTYGTNVGFPNHRPDERAVLNFIGKHLGPKDREYLEKERYRISYLDYDWSLNEQ